MFATYADTHRKAVAKCPAAAISSIVSWPYSATVLGFFWSANTTLVRYGAVTGLHMSAAGYAKTRKLVYVERKSGPPLLIDAITKKPKYVGVPDVHLRARFHIRQIVRAEVKRIPAIYNDMSRRQLK
jgi:hypothetical protein